MMHWCGIKFVAGPAGLLLPECIANHERDFVELRPMVLQPGETPEEFIAKLPGRERRAAERIYQSMLEENPSLADADPDCYDDDLDLGYDPDDPDVYDALVKRTQRFIDAIPDDAVYDFPHLRKRRPGDGAMTDSTLEDFL